MIHTRDCAGLEVDLTTLEGATEELEEDEEEFVVLTEVEEEEATGEEGGGARLIPERSTVLLASLARFIRSLADL